MLKRVITGIIGFPIIALFVALGGWWLKTLLVVLAMFGLYEIYNAFAGRLKPVHAFGFIFGFSYILLADWINLPYIYTTLICLFVVCCLIAPVLFFGRVTVSDSAQTILGFFYVPVMITTIFLTRQMRPSGIYSVWLCFIAAWGCDTGAYFTGIMLGKHKLAPELSPKKTIEGLIGGVVTATLLAVCFGYVISHFQAMKGLDMTLFCALAGFFGAILAQFGDLSASAIKRACGIKDFGTIIPGHGGVLDRFDSVLFTAPAVYVVMAIMAILKIR